MVGTGAVKDNSSFLTGWSKETLYACKQIPPSGLLLTYVVVNYVNFGIYLPVSATMAILALPLMTILFVRQKGN